MPAQIRVNAVYLRRTRTQSAEGAERMQRIRVKRDSFPEKTQEEDHGERIACYLRRFQTSVFNISERLWKSRTSSVSQRQKTVHAVCRHASLAAINCSRTSAFYFTEQENEQGGRRNISLCITARTFSFVLQHAYAKSQLNPSDAVTKSGHSRVRIREA